MSKPETPNLNHLVKTRGDKWDLQELRALKAVARKAELLRQELEGHGWVGRFGCMYAELVKVLKRANGDRE